MQLTQKTDQQILAEIPTSSDQDFFDTNKNEIQHLVQIDKNLNTYIEEVRQEVNEIATSIQQMNYTKEVMDCVAQKTPQQDILKTILEPIAKKIEKFNEKMQTAYQMVKSVCDLADELNNRKKSGTNPNMKKVEEISSGLSDTVHLFDDIDQGMHFYQQLITLLTELDRKVSDYILARSMERDNLVQLITNEMNKVNVGNQNSNNNQGQSLFGQQMSSEFIPQQNM